MHELGHSIGLTHFGLRYPNWNPANPDYTPALEANCKSNYQSVMNYLFQIDLLGPNGVLDFSSQELAPLDENTLNPSLVKTVDGSPILFATTSWFDTKPIFSFVDSNNKVHTVPSKAGGHCDGTPLSPLDVAPTMYPFFNLGTAQLGAPSVTPAPAWSVAPLDLNFDGKIDSAFHGHDDWIGSPASPGTDLRQISATGTLSATGLGGSGTGGRLGGGGGTGGRLGGGGGLGGLLGGGGGTGGRLGGGGGLGGKLGGGGGLGGRLGGGGGVGELNRATANSVTRPPRNLTATEDLSPRHIHLFWFPPTFGQIGTFNIYRQPPWARAIPPNPPTYSVPIGDPGLTFHPIDPNDPHSGEYEFVDPNAPCNPSGYSYFVTAVLGANSTNPGQESAPTNTVPTADQPKLTGCYTSPGAATSVVAAPSAPGSAVHGSVVTITWSVQDDFYPTNGVVQNFNANNKLRAIGPFAAVNGACPLTAPNGTQPTTLVSGFGTNTNQFTFNWDTDLPPFTAGCYVLELDLDSGQIASTALRLSIDVTDTDSTPHVMTTDLPDGVVGSAYGSTIIQDGGVSRPGQPFTWTLAQGSTPLPPGISLGVANDGVSGTLSGTPCAPGNYPFTVRVTDSAGNFGTQALTLKVTRVSGSGVFGPTCSLGTARWAHTATLLNSGKVLITGGIGAGGTVASAELYDPSTATFSAAGTMTTPRASHTATLLRDGTVLLAGGGTNTAEIYDPVVKTFTLTGTMSVARFGQTATLLQDGTVLIAGGFGDTTAEIFDPTTKIFTVTQMNGAQTNMTAARRYHTATLLSNGQVLLVGGEDSSSATIPTLASAEIYDRVFGTFTSMGSLTTDRELHTATLVGGSVYAIGGRSGSSAGYVFLNSAESFSGGTFASVRSSASRNQSTPHSGPASPAM